MTCAPLLKVAREVATQRNHLRSGLLDSLAPIAQTHRHSATQVKQEHPNVSQTELSVILHQRSLICTNTVHVACCMLHVVLPCDDCRWRQISPEETTSFEHQAQLQLDAYESVLTSCATSPPHVMPPHARHVSCMPLTRRTHNSIARMRDGDLAWQDGVGGVSEDGRVPGVQAANGRDRHPLRADRLRERHSAA